MTATQAYADFDAVKGELGLGEQSDIWRYNWEASQAAYRPGSVGFLSESFVREVTAFLRISPEPRDALLGALSLFRDHPAAERLAWHCHDYLFSDHTAQHPDVERWPELPADLHPGASCFHAFVMLSGVEILRGTYRDRGIGEDVLVDTLADIERWMHDYRRREGRWGFNKHWWLTGHFQCDLFALGRLQFRREHFEFDLHAYRNNATREVVLLAPDGEWFRPDGQFDSADGSAEDPGRWRARFEERDDCVLGMPITPDGRALPREVRLPRGEWTPVLAKDEPTLGIHIPEGGGMTHAACGDSLRRAVGFFPRVLPEHDARAFTCMSWILDNQFQAKLPAKSNMRRFQREVYLHPVPKANDSQMWERAFLVRYDDPAEAPVETSLQRVLVDHMLAGGHWRDGGCLLFPEDLDWGGEVYRTGRYGGPWPDGDA